MIVQPGGALRRYGVDGRPVVDGFATHDLINGGHGQLLVAWPNRIQAGSYQWEGEQLQLPLTEAEYPPYSEHERIHGIIQKLMP